MFDFIRKHTKITMWLLFLLIVPSFVLLGMNDHTRTTGTAAVAQVDGREITQAEWDAAHRNEIDRLQSVDFVAVRCVPFSLGDFATVYLGHSGSPGSAGVVVHAQQNKGRNNQQKQQPHRYFGVLANEIKHLGIPVYRPGC